MPDGNVHVQEFERTAPLSEIRNYILTDWKITYRNFNLALAYPRTVFSDSDYSKSLDDLNICPSSVLLILPLEPLPSNNYFVRLYSYVLKSAFYVFTYFSTLFFGRNDSITMPEDEDDGETKNRNQK